MSSQPRRRRIGSVRNELILKSREAALSAVQIFNNPLIRFKSELFVVIMNIAWTYLLHAFYRGKRVEYRYFSQAGTRRRFDKTKGGAIKHWELERCFDDAACPLDKETVTNLRFLIGLRHEIEHRLTTRIDDHLSAKFQACCLNYNHYLKTLFGAQLGIDKYLSFSLQFSHISREQVGELGRAVDLPDHIHSYIQGFEEALSDDEFNSPHFAYRVLFVPKTANRKGQADEVIEFVKADSPLAQDVNVKYVSLKEVERPKMLASHVVRQIQQEEFPRFKMHQHTLLWKSLDGKNPGRGYGTMVEATWYWYESWLKVVRQHCQDNAAAYQ